MKNTIFTGSGVALVTPFCENGTVNFNKLEELVEYHIAHHTDALIVCATTGEAPTLSDEQHKLALECAVKAAKKRIPVIAGTGSNDTEHAVWLSEFAERIGSDALLHVTPYYNKTTQRGLIEHYRVIAKSVSLPIILYNVPSRTGINMTAQTLDVLADLPNIVAIKEASGNVALAAEMMQLCGDRIDMYSGNDDIIVPLMSIGAKGVISVAANIVPDEMHELCEYALKGNFAEAAKMQLRYLDLINALFCEVNPVPVKTAMNLLGMEMGALKLPLCEMAPANLERLKNSMKAVGLLS